ncbi:MAG: hypothetical protein KBT04_01665 [Bacteroidales bacterium]|nr:hypothetical protein [Candidatus Colimorpha onthohippi]
MLKNKLKNIDVHFVESDYENALIAFPKIKCTKKMSGNKSITQNRDNQFEE